MSDASGERQSPAPFLRLVRGNPTPEEAAALVAVLTARARAVQAARDAEAAAPAPRSAWRAPSHPAGGHPPRGAGAWRRSFHPG
ncbi:acyl-CoA carboxylase epsilon subunit [Nocardiopsis sediminis]|uniref:Acyl-CoA carboxylase epsilon subunit n=1 Tax=Nocardiopsis sediminis TaxID=1778267 RepID=A0ABV8FPQ8_9ACTN